MGLAVGAIVGIVLIGESYRQSIVTGNPGNSLFWAGVLLFMAPVAIYLGGRSRPRGGLLAVTTAAGLFLFIPKILRTPFGPEYHDELAHWRQVQDLVANGHLFQPNTIIQIIQYYPGLHIVTATVQELTGLSTWGTALTLLSVFHVIDLLAVFLILEGFTRSARVGAVGALVYSLNSSFMYFDTQFAYESLGVMLFLVTILAVQRVEQARTLTSRVGWGMVAVAVGMTCAVTHHLSTLSLCGLLLCWSLITLVMRRSSFASRSQRFAVPIVTLGIVGFFVAWIAFVAPATVAYLRPYLGQGLGELTSILGSGHGGRQLFGGGGGGGPQTGGIPHYEELAALASPLLMFLTLVATCWKQRVRLRSLLSERSGLLPGRVALGLFGLLYFCALPFLLVLAGNEGARRSWAFTYLGIAVLLAPTFARWSLTRVSDTKSRVRALAMLGLFIVILVGNVAAGLNPSYRFPGKYAVGTGTAFETPELAALARWFPATVGANNRVVVDSFTGLELAAFGRQRIDAPSAGFATFQFWLNRSLPTPLLISELSSSGYRYLVIDKQMALPVSALEGGGFFSDGGAVSTDGTKTVTASDLNRFANYGWLNRVYESTDFAVYRFQFNSIGQKVSK